MSSTTISSPQLLGSIVLDSGAIIKGQTKSLHKLGSRYFTINEVLHEIRDKKARETLETLPFELEIRTPSDLAMKTVYNFAKQTGDFASLSLCDLKIIALTYDLEIEANQQQFIRTAPKVNISFLYTFFKALIF